MPPFGRKTTSKNSSSYCYCAIMKRMMLYMVVCVCQIFQSRLQVNPSESLQFHTPPIFLSRLCRRASMPRFPSENITYCICSIMAFIYSPSCTFTFYRLFSVFVACDQTECLRFLGRIQELQVFPAAGKQLIGV